MKPVFKNLALWLLIAVILMLVYQFFGEIEGGPKNVPYSDFIESVEKGRVTEARLQGQEVSGKYTDKTAFRTILPPGDPDVVRIMREKGVAITVEPKEETSVFMMLLANWLPMIVLFAIFFIFMRQMQGGGKAMTFGKSRAKLLSQDETKVTFADVAGIDEAKEEVQEIVEFLKNPKRFTKLGGRIPKGVLLMGSPGTGKTLLAKAIAGEAGVPFFSISGSDFVEMFVGVGASRVRDLFIQGKKNAPCIIFIDEIDAVGRHRGAGLGGGHDEREQTLNQLLVEMDGFESNEGVILMAATNRPDVLDPALLRPGRFDRQVVVPQPDIKGRTGILRVHSKNVPMSRDVDLEIIARGTPGFSGADLENLVNEAALAAARADKEAVEMEDFEKAKDKVLMGSERRSMALSEEERKVTAYHEAGHAVCAIILPYADPVHKVSIIPRGRALGITLSLPTDDKYTYTKEYLYDRIAVAMGGRAAEEIFLGHISTGASNDIEKATELARRMVCKYGMSDKLGPISYGREEEQIFLGKELVSHKDFSEATAVSIDGEIRLIIETNLETARRVINENRENVEKLVSALLEKETLGAEEVESLIRGVSPAGPAAKGETNPPAGGETAEGEAKQEEFNF
ncbi:ATP-dependent metallopeptidase FtsH/Yme1/Tma family protein [bacterium]|nr:MAG: ATP-dependent metallopeptidase FtsH/Yme1/Tma family protein [bacterium]